MSVYFLYGYYGYGNFGDDLLLEAVIEGIRARDPEARFLVHSLDPVERLAADGHIEFTGLARQLRNIRAQPWRLPSYLCALDRGIARSDALVVGGGTLFIDKGRFNASLALLYAAILIAKLRRKRVVIIGVGIDRLGHPISRWLTRRIFAAAEFVTVRESTALPYLAFLAPENRRVAPDLTFTLELGPAPLATRRARPVAGLCFIDYYRTVEPSTAGHAAYEAAICRLIEGNRDRYDFLAITFQRGIGQRDDWLLPLLRERFPEIAALHVHRIDKAREMAAAVDIVVTTRFHLGILGLLWDKPVIVIDHELKMASLAADFTLPALPLWDFVSAAGIDLATLLQAYDPGRTAERRAAARGQAALNFAWLTPRPEGAGT